MNGGISVKYNKGVGVISIDMNCWSVVERKPLEREIVLKFDPAAEVSGGFDDEVQKLEGGVGNQVSVSIIGHV